MCRPKKLHAKNPDTTDTVKFQAELSTGKVLPVLYYRKFAFFTQYNQQVWHLSYRPACFSTRTAVSPM